VSDGRADEGGGTSTGSWAHDARVATYLGDALPVVQRFAELLAEEGVRRGLLGPREVPRLWARHLLNCAAAGPLLPAGTVVDVGSGAGLPGVVLAAVRPDVHVILLEPMERRVVWLREVVAELGLDAEVVRGRAEELHGGLLADAVTARAVAPLERLVGWTLPLLRQGGSLLALKGVAAADELVSAAGIIAELGGDRGRVLEVGSVEGVATTRVIRVVRAAAAVPQLARSKTGQTAPRRVSRRRRRG
jgi:16S rRNA (guanine527-N7)-methyltransferase